MSQRKRRAFTLVEILIAAAVLAVFMIAVTKMWSKMNSNANRGMWKSSKEKELRHTSKTLQDAISAATLPSIIVPGTSASSLPGGAYFVTSAGAKVEKNPDAIPLDFMITYEHSAAPAPIPLYIDHTTGLFNTVLISVFGTMGFENQEFDMAIGFQNEAVNKLDSTAGATTTTITPNVSRVRLAGVKKVLHWVEAKPAILGDPGTIIWNTLELEPSQRGTYKLIHRKYGGSRNMPESAGTLQIPAKGTGTAKAIIDGVVRMEISAYPLPNDPRLSDCSADDNNQYFLVSGTGATIQAARSHDSGGGNPPYAANHISEEEAEKDVRRNFMLYIKIACAMKGQPGPQNTLYCAESFQVKTNLYVLATTALDQTY